MDKNGFVYTGDTIALDQIPKACWRDGEHPSNFETSLPGVFTFGDVRRGSTKRVASAVGEGSVVVQFVHRRVAGLREVA